jgi:hypothetical protein
MKICSFCLLENPDDALVCKRCDKKFEVLICPDCHKENAIGAIFCELCGRDLKKIENDKAEPATIETNSQIIGKKIDQEIDKEKSEENSSNSISENQASKKMDWGPLIFGLIIGGIPLSFLLLSGSKVMDAMECFLVSFSIAYAIFRGLRSLAQKASQNSTPRDE